MISAPPNLLSLHWQLERQERLLGMQSLDAIEIDYHFARARALREQAERVTERLSRIGASETKEACPPLSS